MKPFFVLGLAMLTGLSAQASPCTDRIFTSAHGEAYLKAETALIRDGAPETALDLTGMLWESDLNCFERQSVRKLRAATFVELGDFTSAIELLKPLASDETVPTEERVKTAYSIGTLYGALGDQEAAAPYLKLSESLKAAEDE